MFVIVFYHKRRPTRIDDSFSLIVAYKTSPISLSPADVTRYGSKYRSKNGKLRVKTNYTLD